VAEIKLQDLRRITRDLAENNSTNREEHNGSDGDEDSVEEGEDDIEKVDNGYERSGRKNSMNFEQGVKIEDGTTNCNNGIEAGGSDTTIVKLEDILFEAGNK
jgi:hypothetical protein